MRIGLTGGIACGKSTVTDILRRNGVPVVDADEISRSLTAPGGKALPAIEKAFGLSYFDGEGRLNRRALGDLIFSNEEARGTLNGILHPMVGEEMLARADALQQQKHNLVTLDIPLLFESGMEAMCDTVWVVAASPHTQEERLMRRDQLTLAQARARMASQMPLPEKIARADAVLYNDKDIASLEGQVKRLLGEFA